jgi:hypothetical protein
MCSAYLTGADKGTFDSNLSYIGGELVGLQTHQNIMGQTTNTGLFSERYRVLAVEAQRLIIKGIITGTVLTIMNSEPGIPLSPEEYPPGQLLALGDPSTFPSN